MRKRRCLGVRGSWPEEFKGRLSGLTAWFLMRTKKAYYGRMLIKDNARNGQITEGLRRVILINRLYCISGLIKTLSGKGAAC